MSICVDPVERHIFKLKRCTKEQKGDPEYDNVVIPHVATHHQMFGYGLGVLFWLWIFWRLKHDWKTTFVSFCASIDGTDSTNVFRASSIRGTRWRITTNITMNITIATRSIIIKKIYRVKLLSSSFSQDRPVLHQQDVSTQVM